MYQLIKRLKVVMLILVLCVQTLCFAQNSSVPRAETEIWLLQKLNKNISNTTIKCLSPFKDDLGGTICHVYKNINFIINSDSIIINADEVKSLNGNHENIKTKWSIPLAVVSVKDIITSKVSFICSYNAIKEVSTNGNSTFVSIVEFDFNAYGEENLQLRINKAFRHLISFIKQPKSKEVFNINGMY